MYLRGAIAVFKRQTNGKRQGNGRRGQFRLPCIWVPLALRV